MQVPRRAARFIARHRRASWNRAVAAGCRAYLNAFDNLDYDGATNGEHALILRVSYPTPTTVLDVGANLGSWTGAFRDAHPGATVHAFEVDPDIAERLAERFASDPDVCVQPVGLTDRAGAAVAYRRSGTSRVTSLVAPGAPPVGTTTFTVPVPVEVQDGDTFLRDAGIAHVGFVKIDTEGGDLDVIRGFGATLAAGRIDALQFEHNEWSVHAGVHLKDFYDLLEPLDYEIGRLFPDCVLFRPWRPTYEREAPGNHVAVHRDHVALRAQLAGTAA